MPNYSAEVQEKAKQEGSDFRNQFGVRPNARKLTGILSDIGIDHALYLTEDLLVACKAVPSKEVSNMEKYGFLTPIDEYIYTHGSLREISKKWGIPEVTLNSACSNQDASAKRNAQKSALPAVLAKIYNPEDLAKAREDWVAQRCSDADKMIKAVHDLLDLGCEEVMSASGVVKEKKLNAGSLKLLVDTYKVASEIKSVALGQPTKLTAQFNHSTTTRTEVKETVVNAPAEAQGAQFDEFEIEPPMALPEANVVEGEVTEEAL